MGFSIDNEILTMKAIVDGTLKLRDDVMPNSSGSESSAFKK